MIASPFGAGDSSQKHLARIQTRHASPAPSSGAKIPHATAILQVAPCYFPCSQGIRASGRTALGGAAGRLRQGARYGFLTSSPPHVWRSSAPPRLTPTSASSEAEWEYAARGQTSPGAYPRFWFGNDEKRICRYGNFADQKRQEAMGLAAGAPCNDSYAYTSPAGHYEPNAFGLYDMSGNAWQWTADCYHDSYNGAPADGSAWTTESCNSGRVVRGGSWYDQRDLRAAVRGGMFGGNNNIGFRVARTLTP
jgi:hypothetical protein